MNREAFLRPVRHLDGNDEVAAYEEFEWWAYRGDLSVFKSLSRTNPSLIPESRMEAGIFLIYRH